MKNKVGSYVIHKGDSSLIGILGVIVASIPADAAQGRPKDLHVCRKMKEGKPFSCPDSRCQTVTGCVICAFHLPTDKLHFLTKEEIQLFKEEKLIIPDTRLDYENWVLEWLGKNTEASCLNSEFHDAFHKKFPTLMRDIRNWGASPVHKAMQILADLYKKGLLEKRKCSLGGNWQPGFPKFALSYSIKTPA